MSHLPPPASSASHHNIASNGYPSTHRGAYASPAQHGAHHSGGHPIPGQIPGGMPYDDPRNLPGVYPFITYQPVARSECIPLPFSMSESYRRRTPHTRAHVQLLDTSPQ